MKTDVHLSSQLAEFFWEWEMFRTNTVEKIKTRILCSVTFSENRAVYEVMWEKNIVQPDVARDENIIWRLRFAC